MNEHEVVALLEGVRGGSVPVEAALARLRHLPYRDLGLASVDTHRELRQGYPEAVFCQGKTVEQVRAILGYLVGEGEGNVLATRMDEASYRAVADLHPDLRYNPLARTLSLVRRALPAPPGYIAVVTAGTADLAVAEEAAETAVVLGNPVERVTDVGVAGVHRLVGHLERLREARVVIVVAGMEGALASVVAGLIPRPVVAVPTSVGYGASFGGLAALLGMLNSCAGGVGVVNIDNGYGAACLANLINRL